MKIRFSPAVARFVQEKKWHPSQRLSPQQDGSLIVEFQLSSIVEVKSWVLSFGREAEVLAPESLRAEISDDVRLLAERYGRTGRPVMKRSRSRPEAVRAPPPRGGGV